MRKEIYDNPSNKFLDNERQPSDENVFITFPEFMSMSRLECKSADVQ